MRLKLTKPLVSVDWLKANLENNSLIILNCTIPKVTVNTEVLIDKRNIKGARFFDIKNIFSDRNSAFPNTVLKPDDFENKAKNLGICKNSAIVVYDDLGIYSAPRVWWMFQLMGFTNIAVLNGGFPKWKHKNYPIEISKKKTFTKGDFSVNYQPQKIKFTQQVLENINSTDVLIVDARSNGRFLATEPEPRTSLKGGHIPNSVNLPFSKIIENGKVKSKENLKSIFADFRNKKEIIFTCGSGITAAILALGASIVGIENYSIYDGSWTEWASTDNLPIAK